MKANMIRKKADAICLLTGPPLYHKKLNASYQWRMDERIYEYKPSRFLYMYTLLYSSTAFLLKTEFLFACMECLKNNFKMSLRLNFSCNLSLDVFPQRGLRLILKITSMDNIVKSFFKV